MKVPRWLREDEEPPLAPVEHHIRFVVVRRDEQGNLVRLDGEPLEPRVSEIPPLTYTIGGGERTVRRIELIEPVPDAEGPLTQPLETPQETPLESVEPVTIEEPKKVRRSPVSGADVAELWRYDRRTKPTVPGLWSWVSTSMFRDRGYWHDFEKGSPRGGSFMDPRGE